MIVFALFVGGYILSNERLSLPGWVPVIGKEYVTLKADFRTAQAVTPGQGQSVTIAGAKIGEIASVQANEGDALVTMNITPKYARYIYRNATMLLRPKTQLKDMTVEVDPGTPSAGRVPSGYTIPQSQTAPDVNFEEFLAALDGETREYLQELIDGAGEGLKGNSENLSAAFKRFDPISLYARKITAQLKLRHKNIEHAIHNFQLFVSALGDKDTEISQAIDASNAVFQMFAEQDQSFQRTLHLLPSTLAKTKSGLGKLARAAGRDGLDLDQAPAVCRMRLRPPRKPRARCSSRARRSSRTKSVRSRARSCRSSTSSIPRSRNSAKPSPGWKRASRCSTNSSTSLPTTPDPTRVASCSSSTGPTTTSTACSARPTLTARSGARVVYLNCEVLPLLTGVERSERDGEAAGRAAQSAVRGGMPGTGLDFGERNVGERRHRCGRACQRNAHRLEQRLHA